MVVILRTLVDVRPNWAYKSPRRASADSSPELLVEIRHRPRSPPSCQSRSKLVQIPESTSLGADDPGISPLKIRKSKPVGQTVFFTPALGPSWGTGLRTAEQLGGEGEREVPPGTGSEFSRAGTPPTTLAGGQNLPRVQGPSKTCLGTKMSLPMSRNRPGSRRRKLAIFNTKLVNFAENRSSTQNRPQSPNIGRSLPNIGRVHRKLVDGAPEIGRNLAETKPN